MNSTKKKSIVGHWQEFEVTMKTKMNLFCPSAIRAADEAFLSLRQQFMSDGVSMLQFDFETRLVEEDVKTGDAQDEKQQE